MQLNFPPDKAVTRRVSNVKIVHGDDYVINSKYNSIIIRWLLPPKQKTKWTLRYFEISNQLKTTNGLTIMTQ